MDLNVVVIWWLETNITEYIFDVMEDPDLDNPVEVKSMKLEWLPFDITLEQLKIFAAFS